MAKLSRTKRYQDLRDQLDEQTTAAQAKPLQGTRLSRTQQNSSSNALPHAAKAHFPHEEVKARPVVEPVVPASPVMDELLGEVKQYNIENGNRVIEDTQYNILKQLDDPQTESVRRKAHVLPMEMDVEEEAGTTMELPSMAKKPSVSMEPATEDSAIAKLRSPKREEIKLTTAGIEVDEVVEEDELDLFETGGDDLDSTIEREVLPEPAKKKKRKKKMKKVKASKALPEAEEEAAEDVEMPSAKMRMRVDEYDEKTPAKQNKKSSRLLNVILVILILLLVAAIGAMFFFIKNLGL